MIRDNSEQLVACCCSCWANARINDVHAACSFIKYNCRFKALKNMINLKIFKAETESAKITEFLATKQS